jgi:DNA polymerase/3'-5' exonuclease PolX
MVPVMDLIGNVIETRNLMAEEIRIRCNKEGWPIRTDAAKTFIFEHSGVQVDIWFSQPRSWGSLLMCRTGSVSHNVWLASGAKARGAHWDYSVGLVLQGKTYGATEKEIYEALGVKYLVPEARNHGYPTIRS